MIFANSVRPGCTVHVICTRCLMHSDQMKTDAISESIIQVLYCRVVYSGAAIPYIVVIQDRIIIILLYYYIRL